MKTASTRPALACALTLALCLTLPVPARAASEPAPWEFMSRSAIGADAFTKANPEWDGRGVVIAVVDTGVEPSMAGMKATSAGDRKILDIRDFSGQGDVSLEKPALMKDEQGACWYVGESGCWRGIDALDPQPREGTLMLGWLDEADFVDSAVQDLDANGTTDDLFGVIVYESEGREGTKRHVVVDVDHDRRFDDEKIRADFLEMPEAFPLGNLDAREGVKPLYFALNLWEDDEETVTFSFDDGAHGSHVAGIATGYKLGGQEGQHGIAPGAQVISLKLGNNTLSGGASTTGSMWKAWHYAVEWSRKHDVPVVIQMSYGVGSEDEGTAVIEAEIDRLLEDNLSVVGCVSNGNEGPGLSTSGLPSCSYHVISSGAVLNRSTAKDIYGVDLPHDRLFYFSSRGAEFNKPDVAAPGFAASSVPAWREGRDVMRGTSMASPQTAGAAALIMSAARQGGLPVVGPWVKAALRRGAKPMPKQSVLDQGPGLINVPRAWDVYQELSGRGADEPLGWKIETESPDMARGAGPAAHWRGLLPPFAPQRQEVQVEALFAETVSDQQKSDFYRAFDLVSTADWVEPDRRGVYTRSARPMEFSLVYDRAKLSAPGLYTARILAYAKGLSRSERERLGPEWDLPVSVAIPEMTALGSTLTKELSVEPAEVTRFFARVPLGANAMEVQVSVDEDSENRVRAYLHDPEGRRHILSWVGGESGVETTIRVAGEDLFPGVWEVVLFANRENLGEVKGQVDLRFAGLGLDASVELQRPEGIPPKGSMTLLNRASETFEGSLSGEIVGYRIESLESSQDGAVKKALHVRGEIERVDVGIEMSAEDFGKCTDIPVRILDGEGAAVVSDGMGYRLLETSAAGLAPGKYELMIEGGFAEPGGGSFDVKLERTYRYAEPVALEISGGETLYPDRAASVSFELASTPPALPDGAAWVIELTLTPAKGGTPVLLELEAN